VKAGNREQGTDKKQKLLSLKLSQEKDVFKRCVARKKTVSLFQSHVFKLKHEFFLFPVARSLFPLKSC
jgi:hypothetical protein